jgi:hypothetical protein
MTDLVSYLGSPDCPYPPCDDGWSYVDDDGPLFEAARAEAGQLGELPLASYTDRLTGAGLFRFFAYDTPVGPQIGALHYDGTIGQADGVTKISTDTQGNLSDGSGGSFTKNTKGEPIPQPDGNCSAWVPDASNSKAVAIATNISYHNQPVAFQDQSVYDTTIDGTRWRFVMWAGDCVGDGGTYHCVSAFRCVPKAGPPPGPQQAGMGGGIIALIVGAIVVVSGLVAAASGRKPF